MSITDPILERLGRLHPKSIDLDLSRIERLLEKLGNPEKRVPPVIHVAGTNGKGSVIAYLRAIAEQAGKKAHVYTSPHLVHFRERIRLAGELIQDSELQNLLEECEQVNEGQPITLFEITTACAFLAFARHSADLLLLETGLGGRLDATNVIERPLATVITSLSMDHQQFLGKDLPSIAREKAGILKPDVPAILNRPSAPVEDIFLGRAREIQAPLLLEGRDFQTEDHGNHFHYSDAMGELVLPLPNLPGRHQIQNAAAALATARHLEIGTENDWAYGLRHAEWPARLQRLKNGPLIEAMPQRSELWLDGGHNQSAGEALADYFRSQNDLPLHLVFAMLRTKEPSAFLNPFRGLAASLCALPIAGDHESFSAEELAAIAQSCGLSAKPYPCAIAAIKALPPDQPARILICGSLYLAGTILADHV